LHRFYKHKKQIRTYTLKYTKLQCNQGLDYIYTFISLAGSTDRQADKNTEHKKNEVTKQRQTVRCDIKITS